MPHDLFRIENWEGIKLVVFDVDGTLYRQRALRARMVRDLLLHSMATSTLKIIDVLRTYRRIRERLANEEFFDFEPILIEETANATDISPNAVRAIVCEWLEKRPLPYLARCRYPCLPELFAGLRRKKKVIGVLSDYPAHSKLSALGLSADYVVSATDDGVSLLKPNPRGLLVLIASAGVRREEVVLIGDRAERDGIAARRAGVKVLIRSTALIEGWQTFAKFDDEIFEPMLVPPSGC